MNLWLVMLIGGILTYLIRLSFIALFGRVNISPWLERSLSYVPPAVLSAIIFPELLLSSGKINLSFDNTRLVAGVIAAFVAWRTRNALLTIVVGMAILWILQALQP